MPYVAQPTTVLLLLVKGGYGVEVQGAEGQQGVRLGYAAAIMPRSKTSMSLAAKYVGLNGRTPMPGGRSHNGTLSQPRTVRTVSKGGR